MSDSVNFQGHARIQITFIKEGNKDDKLFIAPDTQSDGYTVLFDQKNIKNKAEVFMANVDLLPYVERIFLTVLYDQDPCDCIQVDFPTYPSIIVERRNLQDYFPLFSEQLASIQSYWPTEYSGYPYANKDAPSSVFEGSARLYLIMMKNGKPDDKLVVYPEDNGYYVRHDQTNLVLTTETFLYQHEFVPYIQRFLTTLAYDAEPYDNLQVDCPMYPTALINWESISSYAPLLVLQLSSIKNWPEENSGTRKTPVRTNHATSSSAYARATANASDYDWDVLAY